MAISTTAIRERLVGAGVERVDEYCEKLEANRKSPLNCRSYISEAYGALLLSNLGFAVEMRESPDLKLRCGDEVIGAEVKNFRRKAQDDIDSNRLAEADDLVRYGYTLEDEDCEAWRQVENVALKKCPQLFLDTPNLLIIESMSPHCIEDIEILSAANSLSRRNAQCEAASCVRLNGILGFSREFNLGPGGNVFFAPVLGSRVALSEVVSRKLAAVTRWMG